MVTNSTRWWRHRRSTGLMIVPVLLLALARATVADIGMDAKVQHIVTADLAPETVGKAGGLAVAVYAMGHTQFFNYGFADESTKRPITSDTLFNLASVRKSFEAILVALGTLRGELNLDDPVNRYVPELHGDYIKSVTIGELVAHTSGLLLPTDHPPWPNDSFTLQQFLDMLNAWTPQSGERPGKQRIYTHAGYVLLQLAQRETCNVSEKVGQAMAWENIHLNDVEIVDKPGGLNNATAYLGLMPAHKTGIVLLANRGEFPHEIARYRVLPELARE